jgi:cysteine synthase A
MSRKYDSILDTIGQTPTVRLDRLAPPGVKLYVKCEAFNPMGSVKDRLALGVIEDAEKRGVLSPGQTVVEATSGNTGIGLAMVCARKGYPLVLTMAENFSIERRKLMRFLGAQVVLTPASDRGTGMLLKAVELAEEHGWFLCRQFENEANAEVHSRTTAREILDDFQDEKLDYWVTGFGTGGTLKGVARVLKKESPGTKVMVCEPDNSPMLGSGIPQPELVTESHPSFRPHMVQGWAPDFVPKLTRDVVEAGWIDELVPVSSSEALRLSQELARKEGIFTGISGGATLAGALQVCETAPEGSTVLAMLPDTGERYLTTPLFENVAEEMTADEIELSRSTPNYRFDAPKCAVPGASEDQPQATDEAIAFVEQAIRDPESPVVMFALEYCEFCWSLRKLFAAYEIPYRSVDLDSVEYQENDWGGQVRAAVGAKTSTSTIPQLFVGGEHIGGCTETLDAFKQGRLQKLLASNGVAFNRSIQTEPYSFLPTWLHSR